MRIFKSKLTNLIVADIIFSSKSLILCKQTILISCYYHYYFNVLETKKILTQTEINKLETHHLLFYLVHVKKKKRILKTQQLYREKYQNLAKLE